jgi:hypothetical protein
VLDAPPAPGHRPLRTAADVRLAAQALQSAARVPVYFFDDLGLSPDALAEAASASPGLSFGTVARTLAAHVLLDTGLLAGSGPISLTPLRPPQVGAFLARLRDNSLTADDQTRVGAALQERVLLRGRTAPTELEAWFSDWFANLGRRVAEVDGLYVTA